MKKILIVLAVIILVIAGGIFYVVHNLFTVPGTMNAYS